MKVEFEFDADEHKVTAFQGVAALQCFVQGEEETVLLYGHFGETTSLTAVGMHSVALDEAKAAFEEGRPYEEEEG